MKKHFVSLILGFILLGVGSVVTVFELIDYEFINKPYYGETLKEGTKRIGIDNFDCIKLDIPELGHKKRYNIVYDREIGNEILIKYKYLDGIYDISIEEVNNFSTCQDIKIKYGADNFKFRIRTIIDDIINNLKDKKIYNYTKNVYDDIEIIINPEYKDIIRIK